MKKIRKMMALVIAMVMMVAMALPTMVAAQGQGTLTVSNAMKGQTYTAYKVFNAVYTNPAAGYESDGVVYTVPAALESQVSSPFSVSTAVASNGEKIVVLADGTEDAAVLGWVKANYSKFDATGTGLVYSETDGTASATLDYGYYYVTSSLGSVVTIDSVNSAVTVVDKNESKPTAPDKVITDEDSSIIDSLNQYDKELASNDTAVGSTESYKVTFDAVNWVSGSESDTTAGTGTETKTKVTVWNLKDTPTGLNIDVTTVKITVNGVTIYENGDSVDTTNVTTISGGGTDPLIISIPWVNKGGASLYATQAAGSELIPVVVTYDATVTSAAASAAASNAVEIKYNNDQELGDKSTNTYTYKFQLDKVKNAANNYELLPGAKFQLYASDGQTLLKFDQEGTTYTFNPNGAVDTIDLTQNPTALICGIDKASYVLKEIQAPNGYNIASDQNIPANSLKRVDEKITDEDGIESDAGVVSVINEQGTELPSTGGMGTTIFYIIGAVLVIGAGILLVARRRMNND